MKARMFRIMDRAVQKENFYIGGPNAEGLWGSSVNSRKMFVSFYSSVVSIFLNGRSVLELEPVLYAFRSPQVAVERSSKDILQ
ncbi:hypothetical protein quinque_015927 [Culex quinquefasciatus]